MDAAGIAASASADAAAAVLEQAKMAAFEKHDWAALPQLQSQLEEAAGSAGEQAVLQADAAPRIGFGPRSMTQVAHLCLRSRPNRRVLMMPPVSAVAQCEAELRQPLVVLDGVNTKAHNTQYVARCDLLSSWAAQ